MLVSTKPLKLTPDELGQIDGELGIIGKDVGILVGNGIIGIVSQAAEIPELHGQGAIQP